MSKKNRLRDCPVAGKSIEAFECAQGRHRAYACPETCPFNPFSPQNYDVYGKIEGDADTKWFNWLMEHAPNRAEWDKAIERTLGRGPNSEYFHTLAWHAVYRKHADGDSCVEKMARQGFPGLSGDEQLVLQGRIRMRPAIVEVHRVLDDRRLEVVDLLGSLKKPMILVDRTLAKAAVRFGIYALHVFPLPHFHRLFGTAYTIPSMEPLESGEIVREVIRHLGGGTEESTMRRWLMENYGRFEEAVLAVGMARRKAMFESSDAQVGRAVYELAEPFEECKRRLGDVCQIEDDHLSSEEQAEGFVEARVWFANPDDPEYALVGKGATLGRILLGKTHWRLECMGGSRLERFRNRFELLMGKGVRFVAERRDDIAAQMRLKDPSYDPSLVPPSLLRNPQIIAFAVSRVPAPAQPESLEDLGAEYALKKHREWLDHEVPGLNGLTPRQAAGDAALRPELLRLLKERIRDCDTRNLESGREDDINWMVRELGLTEILFEAPPPRARLKPEADSEEDFENDDVPEYLNLPDPEPLPDLPLTTAEAMARFEIALASFPSMTGAFDYLHGMGYPLFDDLHEIASDILTDREYQFFAPILALVVLCFSPKGTCPPEIEFADLADAFRHEVLGFKIDAPGFERAFEAWLANCRQPEILSLFVRILLKLSNDVPEDIRPGQSAPTSYVLMLRVAIDELDRALRGY